MLTQSLLNPIKRVLVLFVLAQVFVTARSHTYATASCGSDRVSGRDISQVLLVRAPACVESTISYSKAVGPFI